MIHPREVVIGVLAGIVLMVAGLVPGLLQGFAQAISNFGDALSSRPPGASASPVEFEQPRWFAHAGVALICATLLVVLLVTKD